jgi:hypothetical protein
VALTAAFANDAIKQTQLERLPAEVAHRHRPARAPGCHRGDRRVPAAVGASPFCRAGVFVSVASARSLAEGLCGTDSVGTSADMPTCCHTALRRSISGTISPLLTPAPSFRTPAG